MCYFFYDVATIFIINLLHDVANPPPIPSSLFRSQWSVPYVQKNLGLLENRFKLTKPQKHKGWFKIWTKLESRVFIWLLFMAVEFVWGRRWCWWWWGGVGSRTKSREWSTDRSHLWRLRQMQTWGRKRKTWDDREHGGIADK